MHPNENIKPRALLTKSAPALNAQAISTGLSNLPLAITLILSRSLKRLRRSTTSGRLSSIGAPILSIKLSGAAPVPPSPLSMVMKSGAQLSPRFKIAVNSCSIS